MIPGPSSAYNSGMTFEQFETSVASQVAGVGPPAELRPELAALWQDARGDWTAAHDIVQDLETTDAAWVHAYLHRKEGDEANARYWYGMAGKTFPAAHSLQEEWRNLVAALL
jgi:hypothetical protein